MQNTDTQKLKEKSLLLPVLTVTAGQQSEKSAIPEHSCMAQELPLTTQPVPQDTAALQPKEKPCVLSPSMGDAATTAPSPQEERTPEATPSVQPPPELGFPRPTRTPSNIAASSSSAAEISHANYECSNRGKKGHADNTDAMCPFHGQQREFHRYAGVGTQGRAPHMKQVNAVPVPGGFRIDGIVYFEGSGVVGAPHAP